MNVAGRQFWLVTTFRNSTPRDFAASEGEFKNWKGNKPKRSRFIKALVAVIKSETVFLPAASIEIPAWHEVNYTYTLQEVFGHPYALAGFAAINQIGSVTKLRKRPMEVFVEEGDEGIGALKKLCLQHLKADPIPLPKRKTVAFQAADLVAWKNRIAVTNTRRLEKRLVSSGPDFDTFRELNGELKSLDNIMVHGEDSHILSKKALIQSCKNLGVPKR